MKKLDLTSLKKALTSLQKAIERYGRVPEDEEIRDSVIQRFETSYELCWKMLSKELQQWTPSPHARQLALISNVSCTKDSVLD